MLTVEQYAEKIGKPYPTVAAWLRRGKIEGAAQIQFGKLKIWQIPEDADYNEPAMGRPPKVIADGEPSTAATAPDDGAPADAIEEALPVKPAKNAPKKKGK